MHSQVGTVERAEFISLRDKITVCVIKAIIEFVSCIDEILCVNVHLASLDQLYK